jgi:hypothetical protein
VIKTMTWTAPAGDLRSGAADVRADLATGVRLAVRRTPAPIATRPGTGLPTAARLRGPVAGFSGGSVPSTCTDGTTQHSTNGTTLGIHSSRRPSS